MTQRPTDRAVDARAARTRFKHNRWAHELIKAGWSITTPEGRRLKAEDRPLTVALWVGAKTDRLRTYERVFQHGTTLLGGIDAIETMHAWIQHYIDHDREPDWQRVREALLSRSLDEDWQPK